MGTLTSGRCRDDEWVTTSTNEVEVVDDKEDVQRSTTSVAAVTSVVTVDAVTTFLITFPLPPMPVFLGRFRGLPLKTGAVERVCQKCLKMS